MKKIVSIVLALMLALTCFAFASAEQEIKWSGTISIAGYMFAPWDEEQDVVVHPLEQLLLEKYGLDVTFDVVYIENANYSELINTRIAGGTAPDIFLSVNQSTMEKYYEQGAIASWDVEFFKENAPDVYEYIVGGGYQGRMAEYLDLWWDLSTVDDDHTTMITLAKLDEQSCMPGKTLMYRSDWLENLGVTEEDLPYDLDSFVELLYRFKDEDPDGNGIDDTYGCSFSTLLAIFGAYGSSTGYMNSSPQWHAVDGVLVSDDLRAENKDALELMHQLYVDGVLDPEFVTGTENEGGYWAINQGFINGKYGCSCHASIDHYRFPEVMNDAGGPVMDDYIEINGADARVTYAPWPAGPDGEYGLTISAGATIGENCVYNSSVDEDKLAVIFQIMNIMATDDEAMLLVMWGVEGETYEFLEDGSASRLTANEQMNTVGVMVLRSIMGCVEKAFSEYSQFLGFYGDKTIINRLNYFDLDQYASYRLNELTITLPSASQYQTELNTYRDETWTSIITGELDIDYYDTYVAEYLAKGGQILADEANEWYQSK